MAHMAMELGEVRFDTSGLPEVPLEHGDAPDCVKEHTAGPRLIRRRARQRARRRWFRNGPQLHGSWADSVLLDDRVEKFLKQTLREIADDILELRACLKNEIGAVRQSLVEETWRSKGLDDRITNQEDAVMGLSRRFAKMGDDLQLLSREVQSEKTRSVTARSQAHEEMTAAAFRIDE